jgi:hypothetical protein
MLFAIILQARGAVKTGTDGVVFDEKRDERFERRIRRIASSA